MYTEFDDEPERGARYNAPGHFECDGCWLQIPDSEMYQCKHGFLFDLCWDCGEIEGCTGLLHR